MPRTGGTLHVTNGDAVLHLFKKAGFVGTQIAWRDVLHEGPVPAGPLEATSGIRARYLVERGYGNAIKINREFEVRDATLRKAAEFDEVVLWFEHDLYDQLHVLQILDALSTMGLDPGNVTIVQSDHYLGMMTADEISALLPKRRTVTDGIFASAREAWAAFTSDDPRSLVRFAKEERLGLPFLRPAFARLCEEFPGADGLSRSQRHALESAARGAAGDDELFRRAQAREEASFMGDAAFVALLDDLSAEPSPAIAGEPGARALTADGRALLAGAADWLAQPRTDRWIGGVRLSHGRGWRYDAAAQSFAEELAS